MARLDREVSLPAPPGSEPDVLVAAAEELLGTALGGPTEGNDENEPEIELVTVAVLIVVEWSEVGNECIPATSGSALAKGT